MNMNVNATTVEGVNTNTNTSDPSAKAMIVPGISALFGGKSSPSVNSGSAEASSITRGTINAAVNPLDQNRNDINSSVDL